MPFHRRTAQPYIGGLPGTHDFINNPSANGDAGAPAQVQVGKLSLIGHPNDGTYYVGFGRDALSGEANRPHEALAENCDFLDDVVSAQMPVPAHVDGVAGAPIATLIIPGNVFMGMSGVYTNTQGSRDRLISVLDANTLNELVDANGVKITVSAIRDSTNTFNRVGAAASPGGDFESNPTLTFSPSIPTGTSYRIVYGQQSSLVNALRSGTNRDFVLRTAIRSAHETAAEVVRFMTQAARRLGGNIQALVATTIETPGLGDNILPVANAMTMDIDPDNTASATGGGLFDVRFNRDATPAINFRVGEAAPGAEAFWENVTSRINLSDVNIRGSGFTSPVVPLSSGTATEGDRSLRVLEQDPDIVGVPTSILKVLNARWTVTVGDGALTFGDFNGVTALTDAVTAYNANPVGVGLRILVKPGTYSVDDLSVTSGDLIIIGTGVRSCVINNVSASDPGLRGPTNAAYRLEVRNVRLTRGNTSNLAVVAGVGKLVIEDCSFTDQGVEFVHGAATVESPLFISRVVVSMLASSSGTPFLRLRMDNSPGAVYQYVLQDSSITMTEDAPVVMIQDDGVDAAQEMGPVIVRNCTIFTAGTGTTGGDPDAVVGVVGVNPAAVTSNLLVRQVLLENLQVAPNPFAAGGNNILLYFRTGNATATIAFSELIIRGGRWDFGATSSTISPFYIGGETYEDQDIGRVVIENVTMGPSGTTSISYGDAATEVGFAGANAAWAAVFITAFDCVVVNDVTWTRATWEGSCGEFFFRVLNMRLDGLYITNFVDTASIDLPDHRIRVEAVGNSTHRAVLKGIYIHGLGAGDPAAAAIHLFGLSEIHVHDSVVTSFGTGSTSSGIYIDSHATGAITVSRCKVTGTGFGVLFAHQGTAQEFVPTPLTVEGNQITACGQGGIVLTGVSTGLPDAFWDIRVEGNTVKSCVGATTFGIQVGPGTWDDNSHISVSHNHVYDNNSGGTGVQILFGGDGAAAGNLARGVLIGNNCGIAGGTLGQISFQGVTAPLAMVGTETGYGLGVDPIDFAERSHVAGSPMIHNRAQYTLV